VVDGTSEGHLVTRDAADRRRFDALFEGHRFDVASYCSWRAASRSDAEDAVAEVFLVAWRRIEAVPPGDAARAWLYATARRVLANQRRSRRRRDALADRLMHERVLDASPPAAVSTPAATTVTPTTEDATVHAALTRLSDRDREVLLLVEWEGLRPAELATVLGCREVTARGRLHRARRRFRDAFEAVSHDGRRDRGGERGRNGDAGRDSDAVRHRGAVEQSNAVARRASAPPPAPAHSDSPAPAWGRRRQSPDAARIPHAIARTAMRKAQR
jgi:RNA polymerase sigma-70 factor, ECF subfamily